MLLRYFPRGFPLIFFCVRITVQVEKQHAIPLPSYYPVIIFPRHWVCPLGPLDARHHMFLPPPLVHADFTPKVGVCPLLLGFEN